MNLVPFYLGAAFIGGLVGAVEIFQRYRADPLQSLSNRWGIAYVLFNAGVASFAYYVVIIVRDFDTTTTTLSKLQWMTFAGLGAAALLHTKLFNVNVAQGREVALGPEIIVQTFLSVIDRELDRARGNARFKVVRRLMTGIDFEKAKIRLPAEIFQAMQQITEEESQVLVERVREVDAMRHVSNQDKSYLFGYYLLDLVGEKFLSEILPRFGADFEVSESNDEGG